MAIAKFPTGKLVITKAAEDAARKLFGELGWQARIAGLLARHACGDWGDLNDNGKAVNDAALLLGERVFSAYEITPTVEFWIITSADRTGTNILLPTDY